MITTISARVLGQRIRQLRTRRGLTQQDLAGEDYSKSYISAIEQGKTRPSLEALQRIASRLEVAAGQLLDPDAPGFVPADPESMPRRVRRRRGVRAGENLGIFDPAYQDLQISQAELYLHTGRPTQALEILRPMLPEENGATTQAASGGQRPLDTQQQQRAYCLAAQAAVHSGNATEALGYVQKGIQLATRLGDREGLEQLRLLLGMAYYQADQPLSALEQHRTCLEAVNNGVVRDPNFKLKVLSNIAADYWALHDNERALAAYRSALDLLGQVNSVERQAAIFWDMAMAYGEDRHFSAARTASIRALSIYEALDNMQTVAKMESRYGNILIEMGEAEAAEEYLQHSLELAERLNSQTDKALALTNLARLAMTRGNLDEAQGMASQAVETSRTAAQSAKQEGRSESAQANAQLPEHLQGQADTNEVLASALALSGEIAAQRGDAKQSDSLFNEAIQLLEAGEAAGKASDIYQRYAQVLAGRGKHEQASRYFEQAYKAVTKRTR
ncbi:MAG: helix-turn-helix domain-containing protein [Chloroflexota bacterium]|nr:helix-turn-helix domain-containing protein [Chloroflexota bacterium]